MGPADRGRCSRSSPTAMPRSRPSASVSDSHGCYRRSRRSRPTSRSCGCHATGIRAASSSCSPTPTADRTSVRTPPTWPRSSTPCRRSGWISPRSTSPSASSARSETSRASSQGWSSGRRARAWTRRRAHCRRVICRPPSSNGCVCAPTRSTRGSTAAWRRAPRGRSRSSGSCAAPSVAGSASPRSTGYTSRRRSCSRATAQRSWLRSRRM